MTKSSDYRGLYAHRLVNGTIVWYVRCQVAGRRRHYGSFTTKTEARAFRDRVKTEARLGRYFPGDASSTLTVEEMIGAYLPTARARRAYRDQARFGSWWTARIGPRRVLSLTAHDLDRARADLEQGRDAATVAHYLKFLKHVMRIMVRPRAWVLDLWADVAVPRVISRIPLIPTPQEELALYRELGREDADIARLARALGLRRGQLFSMRWERMMWRRGGYRLTQFKRQAERLLPLPKMATVIMRRQWIRQGRPADGWMFPSPVDRSRPIDPNAWYRRHFLPAAQRAGLHQRGVTFHTLRHLWATRGLEAGVNPRTLQAMGGWSDLKLVERYTHLVDKTIRAGMERAAGRFRQKSGRIGRAPPKHGMA